MFRVQYNNYLTLFLLMMMLMTTSTNQAAQAGAANNKKVVIAHRGASGYLPEHTLAAKALAYAMRADYLEQDVVMTKDDELIVMHDLYLDRTTNVEEVFPDRARDDGRYYAIDFTLDEVKQLQVTESFIVDDEGQIQAARPQRFPINTSSFSIPTLAEEIEMIQGLNKTLGYNIGIYPEIKAPWFHRREGKDISSAVLTVLKHYGYTSKDDLIYLQCFDEHELRRIKEVLLPKFDITLKLVQLIAANDFKETYELIEGEVTDGKWQRYDYNWMLESGAMKTIATYADGIGPWYPMLVSPTSTADNIVITSMLKEAHESGLEVHPYTFRSDDLPRYVGDFDQYLDIFINQIGVDGVFTDQADKVVQFIKK